MPNVQFLSFLIFLLSADASALPPTESLQRAVAIVNIRGNQIGSGVIINHQMILTNWHVYHDHLHEKLFARLNTTSSIPDAPLVELIGIPAFPLDAKMVGAFDSDYAFYKFTDPFRQAPQTPVKLAKLGNCDILTRAGWVGNEFKVNSTDTYDQEPGMVRVCVSPIPGLSGSPIFNELGELVALNQGIFNNHEFCPSGEAPERTFPVVPIFSHIPRLFRNLTITLDSEFHPWLYPEKK